MRIKTIRYTPLTTNATGYASNVTGASWPLTATNSNTGLAYRVTIVNDAVTDWSGNSATIVGTDAEGRAQTETLALPGPSATVTSTKFFKTVTSVTPAATINADTMDIGWVVPGNGPAIPVNYEGVQAVTSFQVDISGTINYDIEVTQGRIFDAGDAGLLLTPPVSVIWTNHATIVAQTADAVGYQTNPITAFRLSVNTVTNGATVDLTYFQTYDW